MPEPIVPELAGATPSPAPATPTGEPDFARRVVSRRGEVFEVDTPEEAAALLSRTDARGRSLFEADSPEARAERVRRREFGDRAVAAGLAGAASGATLGLSDAAGSALGFGDELAGLREYNPEATILGEVVGSVAPVLATGGLGGAAEGAGLLARGARAVTAPARAVATAAEAAGAAAGRLARGAGTSALRRAGGTVARLATEGAVEGALGEAGRMISEESLGDPGLTAEAVLARLGSGALLGAGTGGVLGAGGAVIGEGVRAARRAAGGAADLLRDSWRRSVGTDLSPTVARVWADVSSRVTGADAGEIERALSLTADGRRLRELGARGDDVFDEGTREVSRSLDAVERARAHASDFWSRGLKREQVVSRVSTGRLLDQSAAGMDAIGRARELTRRVFDLPGDYAPGTPGLMRRLDQVLEARESSIARALSTGDSPEVAADIFSALDELKRETGRLRTNRNIVGSAAAQPLDELYEGLRQTLERTDLWGEAAELQAAVNAAYTRELGTRRAFVRRFLGGDGLRDDVDPFRALSTSDTRVINSFLRQAGTVANETAESTFEETLDSTRNLLRVMHDNLDLPANIRADVAAGLTAADGAIGTFGAVRRDATDLNQFRRVMEADESVARTVTAGALGTFAAGPVGAAIATAVASPGVAVRALGTIERLAAGTGGEIVSSVRSFVRSAVPTAGRAAREAARRARLAATMGATNFQARVRQLESERDPRVMAERLAARVDGLEAAPAVRAEILATATRARAYLDRARPRPRTIDGQIRPASDAAPSAEEMARFLRIARAVDDPLTVLADLRDGDLTPEAVEAVRNVHPRLYEEIRNAVVRELAASGSSIPYDRRVTLGVLFSAPTDPALTPAALALNQSLYAAQTAPAPPRRGTSPAPNVAGASFSGMDSLSARRA